MPTLLLRMPFIRLSRFPTPTELGKHIVVQGGTFYNDAVLRSFEKIAGCEAIRPDIAGIMGAFGAALIARERYHAEGRETTMLSIDKINEPAVHHFHGQLSRAVPTTAVLPSTNSPADASLLAATAVNVVSARRKIRIISQTCYEYKYQADLFDYEPLSAGAGRPRGKVGIPRVLNMYENYPFWFTFFTELKYQVVLSPTSTRKIYELGIESIPSESECYPAKLAHGHVTWLSETWM